MSSKFFVVFYTIIILAIFWGSGLGQERNLHDRFIIRSNGPIFLSRNLESSLKFYRLFLDLPSLPTTSQKPQEFSSLALPDGLKLYFSKVSKIIKSPAVHIIQVRNGFKKLHAELLQRERQVTAEPPAQRFVGGIKSLPDGQIFVLSDPDQNKLVFFKPKSRKKNILSSLSFKQP